MISRLVNFLFRRSEDDLPPHLPYRCGTILLDCKPEQRKSIFEAWKRAELEYVAWVDAHRRPRREWVEIAAELRQQHKVTREAQCDGLSAVQERRQSRSSANGRPP